jgi:hypothetical protein
MLLGLSTGCAYDEYEDYGFDDDYSEDAYYDDDEYYEDEYADDEYDGDAYYDDETWLGDIVNSWLYDSPEDCYEDEYFDEEEQLCLLLDDDYDDNDDYDEPTLLEDLIGYVFNTIPEDIFEPQFGSSEEIEVAYRISGDQLQISANADVSEAEMETHQQLWAYFTRLIPADARTMISQFGIFSDGVDETMAWVEPINENDLSAWIMVIDPADAAKPEELTFTLIHEYGHLLTLNQKQVNADTIACSTYQPQEGCSYENAYLNAFYEEFWTGLLPEILDIENEQDEDRYYDQLDSFYEKYQSQFVSDYAATNLEEDIAESWAHFVLNARPDGDTIAEQKILFFYDYPELVDLRARIIQRTNTRLRRSLP